ncbi:GNAT family N-acetyltransferase [Streptomyces sp. NPDC058045]|uniref:GNAT family N-acetyltransferase n=1 Tax=Streptomyces sp. NPDC058045 TaxID=3346311 RepID=UPI0036F10785
MRILLFGYGEGVVPAQIEAQIRQLHEEAWPSGGGRAAADVQEPLHDPVLRPRALLLVDGSGDGARVLAALHILSKDIVHQGVRFTAAGLSTVVTRRGTRRLGYGRRLATAARATMAGSGIDLGLFTCERPLRPFYESAGWQYLPGTVLIGGTPQRPFPSDSPGFGKVTLGAFFSPKARAAAGSFHGARVAVHPGETDRLW